MLRPAVKTGSGATVKMQMPAAGRFCPTDLHCISAAHKMYLQIMFVFLISPLFVFVFALVFLMLCCAGKYSTAGTACARHALTNYCRRSWEKLNSGHTFEFRPKNWVVLGNGTLGWPNFGKVLRNGDEGCVFHDMGGLWLA